RGTNTVRDVLIAADSKDSHPLSPGPAAVRAVTVKVDPSDPQVTRSLVLSIEFDGRQTVRCPVGEFFGSGVGVNPFEDWYRTVAADGTMTCRWVMPYQRTARVTLFNLRGRPVKASLQAVAASREWDDRSMYFHANWRRQYPVQT